MADLDSLLVVTARDELVDRVVAALDGRRWDVLRARSVPEAEVQLEQSSPRAVLADLDTPGVRKWVDGVRVDIKWLPILGVSATPVDDRALAGCLTPAELGHGLPWALRYALVQGNARRRAARDVHSAGLLLAGEMTAAVAHEINNPLMGMLANLQHVHEELREQDIALPDDLTQALSEAQQGTERIVDIVKDLRHLTRSQSAPARSVRVTRILDAALDMARSRIVDRASIRREYQVDVPVRAHEGRLFQVLLNLVINAAQAFDPSKHETNELVVSVSWSPDGVVIQIRDNGVGISAENLERIFVPYFTTKEHGTGLGLPLSRRYVEEWEGTLNVSSTPGEGTRFTVVLPESSWDRHSQTLIPDLGDVGPGRILVIDDQPIVGRAVGRVLGKKHRVTTVPSAAEAMVLFEGGQTWDIIFCDVIMPGMTGLELYEQVHRQWPHLIERFVFMSGGTVSDEVAERLRKLPAPRVRKPIGSAELRDLVTELLLTR